MKKAISLIVLLILIVSLCGCVQKAVSVSGNSENSRKFRIQLLDKGEGGLESAELETSSAYGSFVSNEAPKSLTIQFDGNTYTGTYWITNRYPGTTILCDEYHVESTCGCNSFEVCRDTKTLLAIDMMGGQEFFENEFTLPILSIEEIEQKAVIWASKWMLMEGYTAKLDYRKGDETALCPDLYCYCFCSMAQGIETTDYLNVMVSDRGTFYWMHALQPGWTINHREDLDSFNVDEAIEQAKIASGLTNPTVASRRFGLNDDGKVYLMVFLTGNDEETPLLLGVSQE